MVEDVAALPVVVLVEVVHGLATAGQHPLRRRRNQQVHQVEEVATLLHQRAAGVAAEPVPVADLDEEREAVLANGHHVQCADSARTHLVHDSLGGRHVAVLEAHPDHPLRPLRRRLVGDGDGAAAVGNRGAQRLLHQHVVGRAQHVEEHLVMRVVRRGDHHCVAQPAGQQLVVALEAGQRRVQTDGQLRPVAALGMRVADGGDDRARQLEQVVDVLDTHHAGADDAIAEGVRHRRIAYGQ